jgi:hypothetical protein
MLKNKNAPLPGNHLEQNRITVNNKIAADAFRFPTSSIIVRER